MEFIKWLLSCGWKGCHSARWQWKCLQIASQCSQYLMLEMWKQLCTRVVFDIFSVLSWWICGFISHMQYIWNESNSWIFEYWSCACFPNNCTGTPAVTTGLEKQALPQFPFPQLLWSFTAMSSWIFPWIRSLMWQWSDLWRCWVSKWLGVVQVRLRMGVSLLGLCSALFLEAVIILQNLCVYFNTMNPEVRGFFTACL